MKPSTALLAAALSLAACGKNHLNSVPDAGSGDSGVTSCNLNSDCMDGELCKSGVCTSAGDAGTPADAGPSDAGAGDAGAGDAGTDGGGSSCTATADYGDVTPGDPDATYDSTNDVYEYQAQLNTDVAFDYLDMQLYDGAGVFANGFAPGTYTLSGDDLNYSTCGLCLLIYTNVDSNGDATDVYFATGGTVTITSLTPTFAGTLTDVTFTHVTIDSTTFVSTPVGDGCDSTIDELDFSSAIGGTTSGACTATADYGTVDPSATEAATYDPTDDVYEYQAHLNTDTAYDFVDMQLFNGDGVFANGVVPGTYTIAGDELNYSTCGLCLLIYTDVDSNGDPTDAYFATGGTVTITSVTPNLTGTMTSVTFTHVIFNDDGSTSPAGDGCDATIDELDFNAAVSGTSGGTDGGPAACTASPAYGTVDPGTAQGAEYLPGSDPTQDEAAYFGALNTNAAPDLLDLELYAGSGAFAAGNQDLATGTFTLSGDDLQYSTCGLCVLIYTETNGDVNPADQNTSAVDFYMATGGTVTLTSLTPTLAGTMSNLTFEHVTIDPTSFTSTPVNDGCAATVDAFTFSASDSATTSRAGPHASLSAPRRKRSAHALRRAVHKRRHGLRLSGRPHGRKRVDAKWHATPIR